MKTLQKEYCKLKRRAREILETISNHLYVNSLAVILENQEFDRLSIHYEYLLYCLDANGFEQCTVASFLMTLLRSELELRKE